MDEPGFGALLRQWRRARRMSQEDLAEASEVSARHVSFLENGRSAPSRTMVLLLASALDLPLRERNLLLHAAGFASVYRESSLAPDEMTPMLRTLDLILGHQEPYPAVAVTRGWDLVRTNAAAARIFAGLMEDPSEPAVARNVVHAVFHPKGLRPAIVNWDEVGQHLMDRLHRDAWVEGADGPHRALLDEVRRYPDVPSRFRVPDLAAAPEVCIPVHVKKGDVELRLFTTLTTLGTPIDVTAQELRIESYFPADEASDRWLRAHGGDPR
jgi:transcriptional regulator with XRE-family HTH domain